MWVILWPVWSSVMVNWMKAASHKLMGMGVCADCVRTPGRSRHLTAVKELRCIGGKLWSSSAQVLSAVIWCGKIQRSLEREFSMVHGISTFLVPETVTEYQRKNCFPITVYLIVHTLFYPYTFTHPEDLVCFANSEFWRVRKVHFSATTSKWSIHILLNCKLVGF